MATWTQPAAGDAYADWPTYLQSRADSQAKMFDDGVTWTSLPTNSIRWNSSNSRFEKWNASAWVNLSTALTDVCKTANNLSDLASAATARTNLGLGTIATKNSPLGLADGGTTGTDAASARSGLGLGSIATQAASAVAITGGTLSGVTALTMTSSSTLSMTSSGTITGVSQITSAPNMTIETTNSSTQITFKSNSVTRFAMGSVGLLPGATNTYDIGATGNIIKDIYADRLITGKISNSSTIAFQISGTTYWNMSSGSSKEFAPAVNDAQLLGNASFYWMRAYSTDVYTEIVRSKAAPTTTLINFGTSGKVELKGNTAVDVYVGGTARWSFTSAGKLSPASPPTYTITYGWSVDRSLSTNSSLSELADFVSSMAADLVTLGIFQ